jgi:predicted DNA-binding antitoxin AbrB/MazE fold protein
MSGIRAIYENGVFRPLRPVKLREGAPVELIIVENSTSTSANGSITIGGTPAGAAEVGPLVGEELAALLDQVAALPYTPHSDSRTDISVRHDDVLYPKNGKQK